MKRLDYTGYEHANNQAIFVKIMIEDSNIHTNSLTRFEENF